VGESRQLFGNTAREIHTANREFVFAIADLHRRVPTYYGPMNKTFGALDAESGCLYQDWRSW
jgi:hypothetical protein